jgi:hypothetical protein
MFNLYGKVAAITGAASGIGRCLSLALAREGCNLALADINKEGMEETIRLVRNEAPSIKVTSYVVDVASREQMYKFADDTVHDHGGVDVIINNAGSVITGTLESITYEDFERLMNINFWGVVYGSMAFLPYLRKRPQGHIVNLSSIFGLVGSPNVGTYCATKFAVRGYTETLYQELRDTSVGVTCIHPGGIRTGFAQHAKISGMVHKQSISMEDYLDMYGRLRFITRPETAAKRALEGIKKNKKRVVIGIDAKGVDLVARLFPKLQSSIMRILDDAYIKVWPFVKGPMGKFGL